MAKKDISGDFLQEILTAVKNFDRISSNYYALQESQRHVEKGRYESAREKLELSLYQLIDSRIHAQMKDVTGKRLSDSIKTILDENAISAIEDKVIEVIKSDSMLNKLRKSMALSISDNTEKRPKSKSKSKKSSKKSDNDSLEFDEVINGD